VLRSCGSSLIAKQPYQTVASVNTFSFRIPSCNLVLGLVTASGAGEEDPENGELIWTSWNYKPDVEDPGDLRCRTPGVALDICMLASGLGATNSCGDLFPTTNTCLESNKDACGSPDEGGTSAETWQSCRFAPGLVPEADSTEFPASVFY
jgi:hypothetical protein